MSAAGGSESVYFLGRFTQIFGPTIYAALVMGGLSLFSQGPRGARPWLATLMAVTFGNYFISDYLSIFFWNDFALLMARIVAPPVIAVMAAGWWIRPSATS